MSEDDFEEEEVEEVNYLGTQEDLNFYLGGFE